MGEYCRGEEIFCMGVDGVVKEWLPCARRVWVFGEWDGWRRRFWEMSRDEFGVWTGYVHGSEVQVAPGMKYRLEVEGDGQSWDINQAYVKRVQQEPEGQFNSVVYKSDYEWRHPKMGKLDPTKQNLRIYEAHIGISGSEEKIHSYNYFRENILPRVKELGFNCVQLMAIPEHAYYGSFGYQVTNLFAPSSRFGTPDEFKALVDEAHRLQLRVLLDFCLSHASTNAMDGIGDNDRSGCQYFYPGERGYHKLWDSKIYDLTKIEVIRFLLSSISYYIKEYRIDGFRLDAVTSMIYRHHGIYKDFSGNYNDYFNDDLDIDSLAFLKLAIYYGKATDPATIFIAEDVSGFPLLGVSQSEGGIGFDYILAMNLPNVARGVIREYKHRKCIPDTGGLLKKFFERKQTEKYVAYMECHDQCIMGNQTLISELFEWKGMSVVKFSQRYDDEAVEP